MAPIVCREDLRIKIPNLRYRAVISCDLNNYYRSNGTRDTIDQVIEEIPYRLKAAISYRWVTWPYRITIYLVHKGYDGRPISNKSQSSTPVFDNYIAVRLEDCIQKAMNVRVDELRQNWEGGREYGTDVIMYDQDF
jgi:hypothetical protein